MLDTYLSMFCTSKREPTKDRIVTGAIPKNHPELAQRLRRRAGTRLGLLVQRSARDRARDRTGALITIADAVIERYRAEKDRRGLLDYDDLIDKTLDLLDNVDAAWVHYKLDLGIDHVLIDEAQDTSPKQWEIIKPLVGEFTAGAGRARPCRARIFAVGDEKQSIFSFQGAAPREFAGCGSISNEHDRGAARVSPPTEFKHSFRSGANRARRGRCGVLPRAHAHAGVTADPVSADTALPDDRAGPGRNLGAGRAPDKRREIEAWDAPFDTQTSAARTVRLRQAHRRDRRGMAAPGPACAGDVLVLVRRRGALFEAIIRALKNAASRWPAPTGWC